MFYFIFSTFPLDYIVRFHITADGQLDVKCFNRYEVLNTLGEAQYNTIQYNTIQYNTIQYNTIHCIYIYNTLTIKCFYIYILLLLDLLLNSSQQLWSCWDVASILLRMSSHPKYMFQNNSPSTKQLRLICMDGLT